MHAVPRRISHPHELVGWETRLRFQLLYLLGLCVCALPLLATAFGIPPALRAERFVAWPGTRDARELTGYVAGGIVLFQLSLSLPKRFGFGRRVVPFHFCRTAHEVAPMGLLFVVLVPTRGKIGLH